MPKNYPLYGHSFLVIFSLYPNLYSLSCEMKEERSYGGITSQNFRALKNPSSLLPLAQPVHFRDKIIDNKREVSIFQVHRRSVLSSNPSSLCWLIY